MACLQLLGSTTLQDYTFSSLASILARRLTLFNDFVYFVSSITASDGVSYHVQLFQPYCVTALIGIDKSGDKHYPLTIHLDML
ncbi:hypothetical protein KSX_73810 [Ktedonospora formicarum]|uniref:Uncharacterized protein n=1 Tax=Ktedonospora formicarum TaxID=2778364 RepID=A0A8J3IBF7_9CHLR|nr:hypothetical protein KSX_73810 [Ktedonospora formicarum]